jgi:hypothetical protein
MENKPKQRRTSCEDISNPNTTSRTPNTNTADKQHQINPPFHQKACYAPAIKNKEEALKHQKAQHPTTENAKTTSSRPRDGTTSTKRKAGQTQPDLSALTTRGYSTKIALLPHNPAEGI